MKLKPRPLPVERVNWLGIVIPILVSGILIAVLLVGLDATGRSSFCGNCHAMRPYVKSWAKGRHKNAACVDCHQEPGVTGALVQRADIVTHYSLIDQYFQRERPALAGQVSTAGCLKCHNNIEIKTIETANGIRVSHKEIINAGLSCGRCHAQTGHASKAAKAARPAHAYCFACHRQQKSGSRCDFCHTRDLGDKGPNQIDAYRKVELDLHRCDGCHATDGCPRCHPQGRQLQSFEQ